MIAIQAIASRIQTDGLRSGQKIESKEGKDEKESIIYSASPPHNSASSNAGNLTHNVVSRNDFDEQV